MGYLMKKIFFCDIIDISRNSLRFRFKSGREKF